MWSIFLLWSFPRPRPWLKKTRLLAVVGLHPNTFKPHTGTKTSVLFVQKYTQEQLDQIATVHDQVAVACPDYEAEIKTLLAAHESSSDVPDEAIPEPIADLIVERLSEPEPEEAADGASQVENGEAEEETSAAEEDLAAAAEERLSGLKASLLNAKQKLIDLDSDAEALAQQNEQEVSVVTKTWKGTKSELNAHLKLIKANFKAGIAALKEAQKDKQKIVKAEIKSLEKQIPQAEFDLKLLTNRGKLTLILDDSELIGTLKERWIAAEVAKQLLHHDVAFGVHERFLAPEVFELRGFVGSRPSSFENFRNGRKVSKIRFQRSACKYDSSFRHYLPDTDVGIWR